VDQSLEIQNSQLKEVTTTATVCGDTTTGTVVVKDQQSTGSGATGTSTGGTITTSEPAKPVQSCSIRAVVSPSDRSIINLIADCSYRDILALQVSQDGVSLTADAVLKEITTSDQLVMSIQNRPVNTTISLDLRAYSKSVEPDKLVAQSSTTIAKDATFNKSVTAMLAANSLTAEVRDGTLLSNSLLFSSTIQVHVDDRDIEINYPTRSILVELINPKTQQVIASQYSGPNENVSFTVNGEYSVPNWLERTLGSKEGWVKTQPLQNGKNSFIVRVHDAYSNGVAGSLSLPVDIYVQK
jgi:hypothetical protein